MTDGTLESTGPASRRPAPPRGPSPRPLVVNVTGGLVEDRWFEADFPGVRWEFFVRPRADWLERRMPRPGLAHRYGITRSCWRAARHAVSERAGLVISHDPQISVRVGASLRASRKAPPHVAWAFNFARLPRGAELRATALALGRVDRFIVPSSMERRLYSGHFGIPIERFELMRWAMGDPLMSQPGRPIVPGDYICAVGGQGRDYATLMEAMARLPDIRLVAVLRPDNLDGLVLPPNVEARVGLGLGEANNILKHSRLMVLPLLGTEVPCGHITIVAAMHLGVASIATRSSGLDDYVEDGVNALTCEAASPADLAAKIRRAWDDRGLCRALAENARAFAARHCSEDVVRKTLASLLGRFGLLPEAD